MALTDAQKKARDKWNKENQKRISIVMNNDFYLRITNHIEKTGETKNGFITRAIRETLNKEEKESD